MINWKVKDFNAPPRILHNSVRIKAQIRAEKNLDGDEIKGHHYRSKTVLNLLKAYSIGKKTFDEAKDLAKCYYCESTAEIVASLQVEHYRPKKVIHDSNRRPITDTYGYYWLGLEWSNLVLACPKCNGRSAKGNIFTISSNYKGKDTSLNFLKDSFDRKNCFANKAPLKNEKPDLLHPEIDNSYKHLRYNKYGEIEAKDFRGKRTIEICDLNRPPLLIARHKVVKTYQDFFMEIVEFHREGLLREIDETESYFKKKCTLLKKQFNKSLPYTLLSRYMNENFEDFFVNTLPKPYQKFLLKAYKSA